MDHESAKENIIHILESKIKFEGHFDSCFDRLKDTQQKELIDWIRNCKEKKTNPIQSRHDKEIIGFVRRFGSNLRSILVRKKDSYFIVIFLDKHKYYENEMDKFGF